MVHPMPARGNFIATVVREKTDSAAMASRSVESRRERVGAGLPLAGGAALVVMAAFLAAALPADWPIARCALVAIALVVVASLVEPRVAVSTAVLAYAILIGFLVNQYGRLSWHGVEDVFRLVGLGLGVAVGMVIRLRRR